MKTINRFRKQSRCLKTVPLRKGVLGLFILACATLITPAEAQTYSLSNTWAFVGVTNNLDASANNRGMAYYAASNKVLVVNKGSQLDIGIYDGTAGTTNGTISLSGFTGGNFVLNKIGFSTDGTLYGANLTTSIAANTCKLYQWTNFGTAANLVYASASGDALVANLSGSRIGDTYAITGGGTSTLMLMGIGGTSKFALFSTTTGTNFTPTVLTIPSGLPAYGSGVQFGFAFYTNNTFLLNLDASGGSGILYLVQYPANFASLPSPVTATVLATNSGVLAGDWLDLSYNPAAGLLAAHPNASAPITLYSLPTNNFAGLASLATTNLSFSTSTTINGNESGAVALGGTGLTNAIYTLDTSAGLQVTAINFVAAPIAPSIGTQPVGGTIYTNAGNFTFSVSATGTLPLHYQWQYNTVSNLATASNILGATNSSYVISPLAVSDTGWYDVFINNTGGSTSSIPVLLTVEAPISNPSVSNLWSIAPNTAGYPYLDSTSYDTRGLGYDTNTQTIIVADKGSQLGMWVLDANTGTNMFQLDTTGIDITGDQFPLDQVGVGDDGVVYACNLYDTGSTVGSFAINSWPSVSASAPLNFAYAPAADGFGGIGDPSAPGIQDRWGDTMAVRGGGVNTQIILGSYLGYLGGPATNAALFTTTSTGGVGFTSIPLIVTNAAGVPAGFSSLGIAFGAGNTFWAKSPGYDLRQIAFDPVSGNCSVIQDIPLGANISSGAFASMSAICLDVANNLLAGVTYADVPNDLSLFLLGSTNDAPPVEFDQAFFPSLNGNVQENGATTVKFPRIYSLDVNNGIVAVVYSIPLLPFSITSVSDSGTAVKLTWQSVPGHTYQVQVASSLSGTISWLNLGAPILATGATTSYTDTSTNATKVAGYYQVIGH